MSVGNKRRGYIYPTSEFGFTVCSADGGSEPAMDSFSLGSVDVLPMLKVETEIHSRAFVPLYEDFRQYAGGANSAMIQWGLRNYRRVEPQMHSLSIQPSYNLQSDAICTRFPTNDHRFWGYQTPALMTHPGSCSAAGSSEYHGALIRSGESKSLSRQVILDEDSYTSALSDIIARDFFPSLAHLDATNGYLSALDTRDPEQISKSVRRLQDLAATPTPGHYRNLQTPSHTPYGAGPSDTPISRRSEFEPRGNSITKGLSLDEFQARYTSEDNASFATILDDENRQRKEKWGWAWEAQTKVEERKAIEYTRRETALLEAVKATLAITATGEPNTSPKAILAGDSLSSSDLEGKGLEVALVSHQGSEGDKQLVKAEQIQTIEEVMAPKKDDRPAGVPGWKFKARNSLMFPPDANQSPYDVISSTAPPPPTKGEPRAIHYGGTRIADQDEASGVTEPSSPTHSRVDAAIAGRPYVSGGETPKVAGHSFVSETASPSPSQMGPVGLKQLMTWGTLQGTPRVISSDGDDTPTADPQTPFRIAEPSRRDLLSHRLANKASKSLAQRAALLSPYPTRGTATPRSEAGAIRIKQSGGRMPPPMMTPRRSEVSLSPAARKLLSRTGGVSTMAQREGWGDAATKQSKDLAKERWTPSPAVNRRS
ncbi:Nuclear protein Es2 [Rhizoctonia solani]|uniref:Nuclear protein Es2 n=1 Tax=Rhizoctonia solani TaxID=456999 RepID=A0A8H7HB53_9AGAM|nr:Nuclear protein Es2 [Rhizoctonia solani]